jgi:hypothetical protein
VLVGQGVFINAIVSARRDDDKDGRTYTLQVTVSDRACNVRTAETTVRVPHDRRMAS